MNWNKEVAAYYNVLPPAFCLRCSGLKPGPTDYEEGLLNTGQRR